MSNNLLAKLKQRCLLTLITGLAASSAMAELHIDNPIVVQRADPFLVRDVNIGCYHFIATSPKFDQIEIRQSCHINELKAVQPKVIWQKRDAGPMSVNIWAPELHQIDGIWYIYFAAGDKAKPFSIRMYVLSNPNANPAQGSWKEEGQIKTPWDSFSLDATTFTQADKRFLVWAQMDADHTYNSALLIAQMDLPTSIKEPVVTITEPLLGWERLGYKVNEGAAVIQRHGRFFMTYSASATDDRYAMGLLWADEDADLLNPASWHKSPQPVFTTQTDIHRYGPGHNSFVVAEDGKTDLMIYHSRDYRQLKGTPLTDPNRHARARVLEWDEKGFPVFNNEQGD
ncbi:family 43 glycosylhydrolase [Neptunicella sp. SCSIO 80796]|uniref:glycoside hydrolase family 43 protein n=1 Tax=Neptunicella plasticusilytica TaxID=3117012 RepID=UPI003A4DD3D9